MKEGFDVHDYGHRMELARKRLIANRKVSLRNRAKIFEFLDYLETQEISLPRRIRYLQNLSKLAVFLKFDFGKAKRSDIETVILAHGRLKLAVETKVQFKIMVKRFYKWLKDPDDEEYPSEVKWIKTSSRMNNSLLPEDILSEADVKAVMGVAEYSRDRAFVAMLFDSGGRIGEVLSLQRKNVVFDDIGAVVVVDGKTGQRRQRLILSVPFVAEWLNDHPDKRPEAPLWVHHAQGCHEEGPVVLDYYAARKALLRLKQKAGISKPTNPQAFRHARATYLANNLTDAQLKKIFGWTQNSRMPGRYVHLAGKDVDEALMRVHGMDPKGQEKKAELTVVQCVRCDQKNSSIQKLCTKCGMPLDLKSAIEAAEMKEKQAKQLEQADSKITQLQEQQLLQEQRLQEVTLALRILQDANPNLKIKNLEPTILNQR
jgi:integrase/ribosomal protein L37E